jgi:hypothetical protein
MNLTLKHEGFEEHLIESQFMYGGIQYIFRFKNDYGASVIKHNGSYGHELDLWELAVIKFENDDEWHLNYDTAVTDDVIGRLTDDQVRFLLEQIKEL